MPIYHLSAKIVSRGKGHSVVAGAAYRAGEELRDDRYGITHDYTRKRGIAYSQILAPDGAPDWVYDRQTLWNRVEAGESRRDSQLAREIEIGIPVEFSHPESVALIRDYVRNEFVSKGMIADVAIHRDNPENPHAHILLTLRQARGTGFGEKERSWNAKTELLHARSAWAEHANEHFAQAGRDIRIDHRTLEAQNIELTAGRKIGIGPARLGEKELPGHVEQRIAEAERIAGQNGDLILDDPTVALYAMTRQRATFTSQDIAKFLHTRTSGADQFEEAYLKVTTSPELVTLGTDDWNRMRFTTRDMLEAEKSLLNRSTSMATRRGHGVAPTHRASVLSRSLLSTEQRAAFEHMTGEGDIKAIVGVAGSGKSTLLAAAREAWEAQGLTVKGAALSGIAAQNLEKASGIKTRTLASLEFGWKEGRDPLTRNDVLVIDEAGMVGTKQLERMLAVADKARAKVVLVGDPEQLQAIEAGAAFRGITEQIGMTELTEVRRQRHEWARAATQALGSGQTAVGLAAYEKHGAIFASDTKVAAREQLLEAWSKDGNDSKDAGSGSRLMLAYTREDVGELNRAARRIREAKGELGRAISFTTVRGEREFAKNDRILFLRNEKSLGVKNGSLGTIEAMEHGVLQIRLDGRDDASVIVDTRNYEDLEHGYATTVHKSQGATVDRTYVLASRYFDRHTTYVALSRHRESAAVFYAREEFAATGRGGANTAGLARERLHASMSRARPKELAHDFLERDLGEFSEMISAQTVNLSPTPDEIQAVARARWLEYRAKVQSGEIRESDVGRSSDRQRGIDQGPGLERSDDDLGL